MSRSTLLLVALILPVVISTRWVRLNLSPSVPVGLYWLSAVPVEVPRGARVMLPVPASIHHLWPRWVPLLKPVAGIPGDMVCHQEGRLQVNTVDYGPVYHTAHNRPLPHPDTGCEVVPEGRVLLASPVPKSLDGRYFGLTAVDTLTASATPLVTWR